MIISFKHEFVFIAIPKTASHSYRVALRPHLGAYDWEQCHLIEEKAFPLEHVAKLRHGHITCTQLQPYLLQGMWESFFSFCTVRNPYDRFISHSFFYNRNSLDFQKDPLKGMKRILENPGRFFSPQYEYVTDEKGRLMVDYIGKFEALQEHFDQICQRIGIPSTQVEHINPSQHPPAQQCFDHELLEMVQNYYAKDFELFDYPQALA